MDKRENGKTTRTAFGTLAVRVIWGLLATAAAIACLAVTAGYVHHVIAADVMTFLLIGIAAVIYGAVCLIRKKIVFPYENCRSLFRKFTQGEVYQELLDSPDQIFEEQQEVMKHFDTLLDRKSILQLTTKQAELLALQNQINPHFLYNTLEAIRGDALCAGLDSIANTTEALATFFRYTITDTGNLVKVESELENVDNYFKIQQYRFGNKFTMKVNYSDVDDIDQLLSLKMPKLTLQPLVENAIFHGLESKSEGGSIAVTLEMTDRNLWIHVRDNGIGIPEEKLNRINEKLEQVASYAESEKPEQKKGGIALYNVSRRIKLLFGEDYGLHLYSIDGLGTEVKIKMPIVP